MKHYFNPYEQYRRNNTVELYSPVSGTIISVLDDGHGESIGLTNKQVHIRSDEYPSFTFVLFHVDILSPEVAIGKKVQGGEMVGYARLFYQDLDEYATSFDIAVWVNTPAGLHLISYFEVLTGDIFNKYNLRGVSSRDEFIISRELRDANPLECDGESFVNNDNLGIWVTLL